MLKETREALERRFPSNLIKQRPGSYGTMLDYIECANIITRLNECFQSDWTFQVLDYQQMSGEVVVLGRLTVPSQDGPIIKEQFGNSRIVLDKSGEPASMGDTLKAATSDAIRKCSSLLGIGLYLYGELEVTEADNATEDVSDEASDADAVPDKPKGRRASKPKGEMPPIEPPTEQPNTGMANMTGNMGDNLITKEQLAQIKRIRTQKKLKPEDVQSRCQRLFGTTDVTSINAGMAKALIAYLNNGGGSGEV